MLVRLVFIMSADGTRVWKKADWRERSRMTIPVAEAPMSHEWGARQM